MRDCVAYRDEEGGEWEPLLGVDLFCNPQILRIQLHGAVNEGSGGLGKPYPFSPLVPLTSVTSHAINLDLDYAAIDLTCGLPFQILHRDRSGIYFVREKAQGLEFELMKPSTG